MMHLIEPHDLAIVSGEVAKICFSERANLFEGTHLPFSCQSPCSTFNVAEWVLLFNFT